MSRKFSLGCISASLASYKLRVRNKKSKCQGTNFVLATDWSESFCSLPHLHSHLCTCIYPSPPQCMHSSCNSRGGTNLLSIFFSRSAPSSSLVSLLPWIIKLEKCEPQDGQILGTPRLLANLHFITCLCKRLTLRETNIPERVVTLFVSFSLCTRIFSHTYTCTWVKLLVFLAP